MGCDIHIFAEHRTGPDKPWTFLPAPDTGHDYTAEREAKERGETYSSPCKYRFTRWDKDPVPEGYEHFDANSPDEACLRDWFDDWNYRLFGMLANVRNGVGFAGVKTGEPIQPVLPADVTSPPQPFLPDYASEGGIEHTRGWPEDCCSELMEEAKYNMEHTPNWLTLKELQEYLGASKNKDLTVRGHLTAQQYFELQEGKKPESWTGGTTGRGVLTLDPAVLCLLDRSKFKQAKSHFTQISTYPTLDLPEGVGDPNHRRALEFQEAFKDSPIGSAPAFDKHKDVPREMMIYTWAEWSVPSTTYTENFEACMAEVLEASGQEPENVRFVFYFDS